MENILHASFLVRTAPFGHWFQQKLRNFFFIKISVTLMYSCDQKSLGKHILNKKKSVGTVLYFLYSKNVFAQKIFGSNCTIKTLTFVFNVKLLTHKNKRISCRYRVFICTWWSKCNSKLEWLALECWPKYWYHMWEVYSTIFCYFSSPDITANIVA